MATPTLLVTHEAGTGIRSVIEATIGTAARVLYLSDIPTDVEPPEALRALAHAVGLRKVRYGARLETPRTMRRAPIRDESNPFFVLDNTFCISCARCVRACDEIQGTFALTMIGRGPASLRQCVEWRPREWCTSGPGDGRGVGV